MPRTLALGLALVLVAAATLLAASPALAQQPDEDLSELWREYPLDPRQETPRPVGAHERDALLSGPPATPDRPVGPIVLALLYAALALGALGVAGAARAIPKLRVVRGGDSPGNAELAERNGDLGFPDAREREEVASGDVDYRDREL